MPSVVRHPAVSILLVSLALTGCSFSPESRFESLAYRVESRLQSMNSIEDREKHTYSDVETNVEGNLGTLSFTYTFEVEGLDGSVFTIPVGWRATYKFTSGSWQYASAIRTVADLRTGEVTWRSPSREVDGRVLAILESAN